MDKEKAKRQAKQQAEQMYDQNYGNRDIGGGGGGNWGNIGNQYGMGGGMGGGGYGMQQGKNFHNPVNLHVMLNNDLMFMLFLLTVFFKSCCNYSSHALANSPSGSPALLALNSRLHACATSQLTAEKLYCDRLSASACT